VVLLQDVRSAGAVVEPAGTRGVVKRSTGELVIVTFDGGRTMPVKMEKLGNDNLSVGDANMTTIANVIQTPTIDPHKLVELIQEAARCYGFHKRMETLLVTLAPGRSMENAADPRDAVLEAGYEQGKQDAEAAYTAAVSSR